MISVDKSYKAISFFLDSDPTEVSFLDSDSKTRRRMCAILDSKESAVLHGSLFSQWRRINDESRINFGIVMNYELQVQSYLIKLKSIFLRSAYELQYLCSRI